MTDDCSAQESVHDDNENLTEWYLLTRWKPVVWRVPTNRNEIPAIIWEKFKIIFTCTKTWQKSALVLNIFWKQTPQGWKPYEFIPSSYDSDFCRWKSQEVLWSLGKLTVYRNGMFCFLFFVFFIIFACSQIWLRVPIILHLTGPPKRNTYTFVFIY